MSLIDSIREETCFAGIQGKTDEEVLGILSDKLYEQGIVKEDYKKNVILREKNYPTGLPLVHDKVAIPHTDACYVEETRICVASLKEPVEFGTMGSSSDEKIPVHLVVMLAIKEQHAQLDVLQELINLIVKNEKMIKELIMAEDSRKLYNILKTCLD